MGSLIGIRRRIKSAKNIAQITRAMQMVSASKMKRAQDTALSSRPFTEQLGVVMSHVSVNVQNHSLTTRRAEKNILVLLVSTNKGMCGGLNVNLYRGFLEFVKEHPDAKISVVTIGKKAKFYAPSREIPLVAKFNDLSETPTFLETRPISRFAMDSFTSQAFDHVYLAYPKFISTLQNETSFLPLLPISPSEDTHINSPYTIEPSESALLDSLLPYQIEMTVYQTILEARASEHSARMVAMKSASDNAKELIGNLTLDYNQARQSQVTSELLDVTTARMALE